MTPVEAVVFDWGGTLTPWHEIDLVAQWYAYAQVYDPVHGAELARRLFDAEESFWQRQRATFGAEGTGHLEGVFERAGIDTARWQHRDALEAYLDAWDPHTHTEPRGRAAARGAARRRPQGGRALEHHVAEGVPRAGVRRATASCT